MATVNIRQSIPEPYDPKQRLVGGIVLVILMLLLYVVLKAILGISSSGAAYALRNALQNEIALNSGGETAAAPAADAQAGMAAAEAAPPRIRLPEKFVFLALNGKPWQEADQPLQAPLDKNSATAASGGNGEKRWVVQAASFREKDRADKFVGQLKEKQIDSSVVKTSNSWYGVRLTPQSERRKAEQQLQELRAKTGKQGMLMQVD